MALIDSYKRKQVNTQPEGGPSPLPVQNWQRRQEGRLGDFSAQSSATQPQGGPSPYPVQNWQTRTGQQPGSLRRALANQGDMPPSASNIRPLPPTTPPNPNTNDGDTSHPPNPRLEQMRQQLQQYMPTFFEPAPYIQQMQTPWDLFQMLMQRDFSPMLMQNSYPGQEWLKANGLA